MAVGGVDIVLAAPRGKDIVDRILHACRRRWPDSLFQDVNEAAFHSLRDTWVWSVGTASNEFFIYRDDEARRAWEVEGAGVGHANSMLHFLIDQDPGEGMPAQVTLVCDRWDDFIRQLQDGLRDAFEDLGSVPVLRGAAA
jgi:hypothetical protein